MENPAAAEPALAAEPAPIAKQERASYRPTALDDCLSQLRARFDAFAPVQAKWRRRNAGYHLEVARLFKFYVPPGASVLEIGCGAGDLLAALAPARGVGIDLSGEMIALARQRYPKLRFEVTAAETADLGAETFDYIILSDTVPFLFDIRGVFERLKRYCHARTRLILNTYSRLWQPIITLAEDLGLKYRQPILNWVTTEDLLNLLQLAGYEVVQSDSRILSPKRFPLLSRFMNRCLAPFAPFRWLCLSNWVVARLPQPLTASAGAAAPTVSVVCPCRNEAGNIPKIVERLPKMGVHTELIFVEGGSLDGTFEACMRAKAANPQMDIAVLRQTGSGKRDAVELGFSRAKGELLMILDADLSVAPEELPTFYEVLASGRAEFVNGSRLVYPMENQAMRFLNLLGNKFFSMTFSWLIGQNIKDTLCGTKVLLRRDYERLAAGRAYFGNFDPFGDFDLLFGAAKLGLRIADLPVRYRSRVYGLTQIRRFRHGFMLLKMCGVALWRLKMR